MRFRNELSSLAEVSLYIYIYQSLHVSGDYGPFIRRNRCVCVTLGTCYSVWMTVWYAGAYTHTCFSWWRAHSCPKHAEIDRYKYTKKNCAPRWFYLRDCVIQCSFFFFVAIIIHDESKAWNHMHKKASVKSHGKSLSLAMKLIVIRCKNTSVQRSQSVRDLLGSKVRSILKNTDKIQDCGKTATPFNGSEIK